MANNRKDEFTLQMFDGTNYDKWKFRLKLFFQMKKCNEVIEHDEKPTATTQTDWDANELKAKNYIVNSMTDTQLELIISESTAKKMIDKLDGLYLAKSSVIKLLCKRRLLDLRMKEDENPNEFFNEFERYVNELKNAGETVSNEDKLNYLLLTLPESMTHMVDIVDALPEKDKSVEYVKSKLKIEFQKRQSTNVKGNLQAFSSKTPRHAKNLHQQSQYKPFHNRNAQNDRSGGSRSHDNTNRSNNAERRCYKCNELGHIQRFCRKNQNWQHRPNQSTRQAGNSVVEEKVDKNSFKVEVMSTNTETNTENELTGNKIHWLLDSGCSDHIINSDEYFSEYVNLKNPINVKVGDGFSLKAEKIGNIINYFEVSGEMIKTEIKNVYYVPNMKQNLLSVSSIVNQNNYLLFEKENAKIYNAKEQLIATGLKKKKLFKLIGTVPNQEEVQAESYKCSTEISNKEKWHRILGHVNFRDLKNLCESQLLDGLPRRIEDEFLKCEVCLENKMTNLTFKNNRSKANDVLEIIHTDVHGPITQTGYKGEKYFVSFIDDYSKIAVVYCIKYKSEVYDRFVEYIKLMQNQTGKRIKEIHCDNGKEYINKDFYNLAKQEGIYLRPAPPYTHELNGVAERFNRTIMDRARCLLAEAKLDKLYWPECVYTAAYIGNRLPANTKVKKTPYEIFFNKKPDVSNLQLYGSTAFVRIPEECRPSKLHSKAAKGILIGYTDFGYKILIDSKVIVSRHVQFIDRSQKYITISEEIEDNENITKNVNEKRKDTQSSTKQQEPETQHDESEKELEETDEAKEVTRPRPKRNIKMPKKFDDHVVYVNYVNANVPENYEEAVTCAESKKWLKAMEEELKSLESNETWSLVDTPDDKQIIEVKWIYRIKSDGKYKARMVAKGFQQLYEENEEVYAPVARMNTLKVLLSVACVNGWKIEQMDVQTAFLNGKIKSEVYIYPPDGYKTDLNKVCLLKKSLYGLRESPRDWYECFHEFMSSVGLKRSNNDYCLYTGKLNNSEIYIILYVDDLLICSYDEKAIKMTKNMLSEKFRMKELGTIKHYLGIEVDCKPGENKMYLSQQKYIESLAEKYGVKDSKSFNTPMEINLKLEQAETVEEGLKYRNLIGALLYIANGTRPDVSFSVNYLSRYQNSYNSTHYKYALRVLKYLYCTRFIKLVFDSRFTANIDAYVDADWAADIIDRKSTTGILLRVFGNPVLWRSQKQKIVSRAPTHAEYYALADCVEEILPIRGIATDLGVNVNNPITVYEDNTGAIALAKNGKFSKNSKHIDVSYHFVNDYEKKNVITVEKISTDDQIADILTKALSKSKFQKFRELLNLKITEN